MRGCFCAEIMSEGREIFFEEKCCVDIFGGPCHSTSCVPGKYLDFVPLHVPPCVSTELYVKTSTAFYVDFLQYNIT